LPFLPELAYVKRWSVEREANSTAASHQAKEHSRYFLAAFRPFTPGDGQDWSPEAWRQHLSALRLRAAGGPPTDVIPFSMDACCTLLRIIDTLRLGLKDDAYEAGRRTNAAWRQSLAERKGVWLARAFVEKRNTAPIEEELIEETDCTAEEARNAVEAAVDISQKASKQGKDHSAEEEKHSNALAAAVKGLLDSTQPGQPMLLDPTQRLQVFVAPKDAKGDFASDAEAPVAPLGEVVDAQNPFVPSAESRLNGHTIEQARAIIDVVLRAREDLSFRLGHHTKLDETQRAFVYNTVLATLRTVPGEPGYHILLHGGPGTGKSETSKNFIAAKLAIHPRSLVAFAPTGTAAVNLHAVIAATTLHSKQGLKIPTRQSRGGDGDLPNEYSRLKPEQLFELQAQFKGVDTVLIDEISYVSTQLLYWVDQRLREISQRSDVPFGGYSMVVVGDFFQLQPVGGTSLAYGSSTKARARTANIDSFNVVNLVTQHRAPGEDAINVTHRKILTDLRCADTQEAALKDFFALHTPRSHGAKIVRNALVMVSANCERAAVNRERLRMFALETQRPILRIRIGKVEHLHVQNAPAMCLVNQDIARGMVNGTLVVERGLVVATNKMQENLNAFVAANGRAGEVLDCTNFKVSHVAVQAPGSNDVHFLAANPFDTNELAVACGFGFTIHKMQGNTLRTPAHIDFNVKPPHLSRLINFAAFYVAISRCSDANQLYVLPPRNGPASFDHILKLKPNQDIMDFIAGMERKAPGTTLERKAGPKQKPPPKPKSAPKNPPAKRAPKQDPPAQPVEPPVEPSLKKSRPEASFPLVPAVRPRVVNGGIANRGATCFANATLQLIARTPLFGAFREPVQDHAYALDLHNLLVGLRYDRAAPEQLREVVVGILPLVRSAHGYDYSVGQQDAAAFYRDVATAFRADDRLVSEIGLVHTEHGTYMSGQPFQRVQGRSVAHHVEDPTTQRGDTFMTFRHVQNGNLHGDATNIRDVTRTTQPLGDTFVAIFEQRGVAPCARVWAQGRAFRLCGMVRHSGATFDAGHYVAFVHNDDDHVREYNDGVVSVVALGAESQGVRIARQIAADTTARLLVYHAEQQQPVEEIDVDGDAAAAFRPNEAAWAEAQFLAEDHVPPDMEGFVEPSPDDEFC
jgi:hypothetical protein